jgi:hypothetical protein
MRPDARTTEAETRLFQSKCGELPCSVIRPTLTQNGSAVATIKSFTADKLFEGQSDEFFDTVMAMAHDADAAKREL